MVAARKGGGKDMLEFVLLVFVTSFCGVLAAGLLIFLLSSLLNRRDRRKKEVACVKEPCPEPLPEPEEAKEPEEPKAEGEKPVEVPEPPKETVAVENPVQKKRPARKPSQSRKRSK